MNGRFCVTKTVTALPQAYSGGAIRNLAGASTDRAERRSESVRRLTAGRAPIDDDDDEGHVSIGRFFAGLMIRLGQQA